MLGDDLFRRPVDEMGHAGRFDGGQERVVPVGGEGSVGEAWDG